MFNIGKEREAFEEFILSESKSKDILGRYEDDEYIGDDVHHMWIGWLARAELAQQEPSNEKIKKAVKHAQHIFLSSEYTWADYVKDLYDIMRG